MKIIRDIFVILTCGLLATQFFILENKTIKKENKVLQKIENKKETADPYSLVTQQIEKIHQRHKLTSSVGNYGKSQDGKNLTYIRIGTQDKPKILVQSGINGYETQAVQTNLNLISFILNNQNDDDNKWLLENRDIYFIPVVSPDSYQSDKNNNNKFPQGTKYDSLTVSVKQLVEFANENKFKVVLNLHDEGSSIVLPEKVENKDSNYVANLGNKLSSLSGLGIKRCGVTRNDLNWFYATGSCSIVMNIEEKMIPKTIDAIIALFKDGAELDMNPRPIRPIFYQAN